MTNFPPIGQLTERLTLQAESHTPDDAGGYTSVWITVATLWGAVTPTTGHETVDGAQLAGRASYRFSLRRRDEITTAHRLVWRNAAFNIRSVTHQPGADRTDILAEEGTAV